MELSIAWLCRPVAYVRPPTGPCPHSGKRTYYHVHTSEPPCGRIPGDLMLWSSRAENEPQEGMGPAVTWSCGLRLSLASDGIQGRQAD